MIPVAKYQQTVEGLMCCYIMEKKVPLLMRSIYKENKTLIGKVDDVFGPVTAPGIAIKPVEGVKGESFSEGEVVYADPYELRDITFFMPKPAVPKSRKPLGQQGFKPPRQGGGGRGGFRGAPRGGPRGGGFRGGPPRGGPRGGGFRGGAPRGRF